MTRNVQTLCACCVRVVCAVYAYVHYKPAWRESVAPLQSHPARRSETGSCASCQKALWCSDHIHSPRSRSPQRALATGRHSRESCFRDTLHDNRRVVSVGLILLPSQIFFAAFVLLVDVISKKVATLNILCANGFPIPPCDPWERISTSI